LLPQTERPPRLPSEATARRDAFLRELRRLAPVIEEWNAGDYVEATYDSQTGDNDRALASLDRAIERNANLTVFAGVDPRLDALARDPRFASRLAAMKLAPPAP
jgi:hypothetical protein